MADQPALAAISLESPEAQPVQAVELIRPMRGGSRPWLLRGSDGAYYVVKFQDNPQHVRVLANEMLAAVLARIISLPAADPAFIQIEPALADPAFSAASPEPLFLRPGLHFGSRFPGDPAETLAVEFLPDRLLRAVGNLREAFLGALVFDKWTCNCDGRQVVFYRGAPARGYTACLIDHGFCFNDGDWSFPDCALHSLYPRRWVYDCVRGLESFEPFLSRIENLEQPQLDACARRIPPEWCDGDPGGPARLMEELYQRRRKLRQILVDLKNSELRPFPNWK